MIRLTYVSHSFTEDNLRASIKKFAASGGWSLKELACAGALGYKLSSERAIVEAIFRIKEKTVYIDIQSGIDIDKSLEFVAHLSKSGFLKSSDIAFEGSARECSGELISYTASVISRKKKPELAIVYLSKLSNGYAYGYDIDEYRLAKRLHGIAHVITEGSPSDVAELHRLLKGSERWAPNKGYVGIYYPDGEYNILREPKTSSTEFNAERYIVSSITERMTATSELDRLTFDKLLLKRADERARGEKVVIRDEQLSAEIAEQDEIIATLRRELTERDGIIEKLRAPKDPITPLQLADFKEARPGEFSDFFLTAVKILNAHLPDEYKRIKQIASAILLLNTPSNYERDMLDDIRANFRSGDPSPAIFKKYGITLVRQGGHSVYEYCGISQPLSSTPSDECSRDNELRNIKHSFCVCL